MDSHHSVDLIMGGYLYRRNNEKHPQFGKNQSKGEVPKKAKIMNEMPRMSYDGHPRKLYGALHDLILLC